MMIDFLRDESGATAIEYAIIALMIGVAIVGALYGVRAALNDGFGTVVTGFSS